MQPGNNNTPFQMVATTMANLEPVLLEELIQLGASEPEQLRRAVAFNGDLELLYKANYTLRTALRILVPIHFFNAEREEDLYDGISAVDWSQHLRPGGSLAVDPVVNSKTFRHSQYVAQLTKDAIVDQFRARTGKRPDVNLSSPDLRINVRIFNDQVHVSLDSTGDSLHKRGYRRDTVEAPLNEVLAAGMIALSGWKALGPFVDAMCGSGTLPIEAAYLALNRPAQKLRVRQFGFERWMNFKAQLWEKVREQADRAEGKFEFPILASDKDSRARNTTAINVMAAELEDYIQVDRLPFEKVIPPDPPGTLIINPPYDERLALDDAVDFYKKIGDRFKNDWKGWNAWVLSGHTEALKHLGLKPRKKVQLVNGAIECGFYGYDLY